MGDRNKDRVRTRGGERQEIFGGGDEKKCTQLNEKNPTWRDDIATAAEEALDRRTLKVEGLTSKHVTGTMGQQGAKPHANQKSRFASPVQ